MKNVIILLGGLIVLLPSYVHASCSDSHFHHWSNKYRYVFSDSRNRGFQLKISTGYREDKCFARHEIKCSFKSSVTPDIPIKEMEIDATCGKSSSKVVTKTNVSKAASRIGWTDYKGEHRRSTHQFKIDDMIIKIEGKND